MKQQQGGTLLGFIIGVVVGLAAALAVAVYVTKVPVPFMNKGQSRSAEQDAAEAKKLGVAGEIMEGAKVAAHYQQNLKTMSKNTITAKAVVKLSAIDAVKAALSEGVTVDVEIDADKVSADAIAARVAELTGQDRCSCAPGDFDGCAYCDIAPSYDAYRVEVFDTLERDPTGAEWFSAGLGTHCDRCGFETHPETGGVAIGKFAICEDCLTLADWDVIDPQRAAEMRAEEAEAAHG